MAESDERADEMREELFALLRARKGSIVDVAVEDTGVLATRLAWGFDQILELVSVRAPSPDQLRQWRERGVDLAREGAPSERVFDAYLSLNWAIWEAVMQAEHIERAVVLDFADRLLRGMDEVVAAISEGYVRVELELAATHSERRRAVLEEILTAPRTTPADRARIRLRCERNGLGVNELYRLVVAHVDGLAEDRLGTLADGLERTLRVPQPSHRDAPGIRLPVVLEWRGRILVFGKAGWAGEHRLRPGLAQVLGERHVAVDSGPIEGIEPLADRLAEAEYSATVAEALGRWGWIDDPGELALETAFLLDERLLGTLIERELGPLLADQRMGEELVETLSVYLGSRQNVREAARRLHLAPRTVSYRLERIETLLGHDLDGEAAARAGAALLALRVSRRVGALGGDPAPG